MGIDLTGAVVAGVMVVGGGVVEIVIVVAVVGVVVVVPFVSHQSFRCHLSHTTLVKMILRATTSKNDGWSHQLVHRLSAPPINETLFLAKERKGLAT